MMEDWIHARVWTQFSCEHIEMAWIRTVEETRQTSSSPIMTLVLRRMKILIMPKSKMQDRQRVVAMITHAE